MDGLSDLYQEVILDHYRRPRNFGLPPEAERQADGHNPLCGDRVRVAVHLDGGRIAAIGSLGKLEALAGVREFPMRVKCATLARHTLEAALEGATSAVSTE